MIKIDCSKNDKLSDFTKATLKDRYLYKNEDPQDRFATIAQYYSDNDKHAQRIYDYISNLWFMPATPILANGGRGNHNLPISCFLNKPEDSIESIISYCSVENPYLSTRGGGIGTNLSDIRSLGESVGSFGHAKGLIATCKLIESNARYWDQGGTRRGATAVYIDISHPEIEEFLEIRRPTGDEARRARATEFHHAVVIPDAFMVAVEKNDTWDLVSPKDKSVIETVSARNLWIKLITTRLETGEPYILFIDNVKKYTPEHHKKLGLFATQSNLCNEIVLPTGKDHLNKERTAVCCLSSLNLTYYNDWENHPTFIEDVLRFLDNVLQDFIERAPDEMERAKYSAMRERSIGLGVMGFHTFLQFQNVPIDSILAKSWNKRIFSHIKQKADEVNNLLANEKGSCPDAQEAGYVKRFSYVLAIAPTASISNICGGASPSIEPYNSGLFTQKTLSGSFKVINPALEKILIEKGRNTKDVWSSITVNHGSIQHLDFFTKEEKEVFKTAFEINQLWLVELASDRVPYICQSQSFNIFIPSDINKKELHNIHFLGWKRGLKGFYYCRSKSIQRADEATGMAKKIKEAGEPEFNVKDYNIKECLACQ